MKYDHVGRPTNEEVSYKKRLRFFKLVLPILIIVILGLIVYNMRLFDHLNDFPCSNGYHLNGDKCVKEEIISAILLGDTNSDNQIDINDLEPIQKALSNNMNNDEKALYDINRDNSVDLFDYKDLDNYLSNNSNNYLIGTLVCPLDNDYNRYKLAGNQCIKTMVQSDSQKKEYKIIFDSNGGTFADSNKKTITKTMKEKDKLDDLPNVTRKGYSFKGWYLNKRKISDKDFVTKNITLKAKWSVRTDKVKIVFDSDGGQILKHWGITVSKLVQKKTINTSYGKLPKTYKKGYKFKGWFVNKKRINENTKILDETVVIAKWRANNYKISLRTDHGKIKSKTIKVKYGMKINGLPQLKSTKKLEFLGWYTAADGKGRKVDNNTIFTSTRNVTLYAYWSRI